VLLFFCVRHFVVLTNTNTWKRFYYYCCYNYSTVETIEMLPARLSTLLRMNKSLDWFLRWVKSVIFVTMLFSFYFTFFLHCFTFAISLFLCNALTLSMPGMSSRFSELYVLVFYETCSSKSVLEFCCSPFATNFHLTKFSHIFWANIKKKKKWLQ